MQLIRFFEKIPLAIKYSPMGWSECREELNST